MNWKKLYRIYKEEGLTVRKRDGRKRAVGTRAPMHLLTLSPPRLMLSRRVFIWVPAITFSPLTERKQLDTSWRNLAMRRNW